MKKVIAIVLAVAVIGVGGWLLYSQVIANPERLIVGEWESDDGIGIGGLAEFSGYEFDKEGNVTIKGKLLIDVDYEGTYEIDKDSETLTVTYEILGIEYTNEYAYEFEKGSLTLTDASSDAVYEFTKAEK